MQKIFFVAFIGIACIAGDAYSQFNNNFWGSGAWNNLHVDTLTGTSNALLTPNISYLSNNPEFGSAPFRDPNTEGCGTEYNASSIEPKGNKVLSSETFDTLECNSLGEKGENYGGAMMYQEEYDTLRKFIELCAMKPLSYTEFGFIGSALYLMDTNLLRWVYGREWYKKVLYYNPDTNFYCADVKGLSITFRYFEGRGFDALGYLAILKYCRDNNRCLSWLPNYDTEYVHNMNYVISTWRDTVKDSLKTPLDTTLPSIDELGLGILRGQNGVVSASGTSNVAIGDLSLVENPFHSEAILRYRLNHAAMVRVDVYDALGRIVAGEGEGYKHEGEYQIPFDAHSWSSGVYYIRLSTMAGEVQTVKAIRE